MMGNFLEISRQHNELRKLKMAINSFQQEITNLKAGFNGKIKSSDEDLIEHLFKIDSEIEQLLRVIKGTRIRVSTSATGKRRNSAFESELGRVGQLKGELFLLKSQLLQLKKKLPELLNKLADKMNSPMNTGAKSLEHLQDMVKAKTKQASIQKHVSASPYDAIQKPSVQAAGLDGIVIGLIALLYLVLAKMKQGRN